MEEENTFGVIAQFENPGALLHAAQNLREKGYTKYDAHSPFPVHGMDDAMGLGNSKLGLVVFMIGSCGALGGFFLQYWVSVHAYALTISGKPLNSFWAFIPVTFEIMVLSSALTAVFGMFAFNKLPMFYHPLFKSENFKTATSHGFWISVEASDPKFEENEVKKDLEESNGKDFEIITD